MSQAEVIPVPADWAARAHIDAKAYDAAWDQVKRDPEGYWKGIAARLDWIRKPTQIKDVSFHREDFRIRWYADGVLNASVECLDRHLPRKAKDIAFIWEGDDPKDSRTVTYAEAHAETCRMANVLKAHGVRKGDRVTIYMPMIPETAYAMLACARIGAIHSVVFGGFAPDSIAGRIQDCGSTFVITADEGLRGGRVVPLKANVDEALKQCPDVKTVLVVARTGNNANLLAGRDLDYAAERAKVSADCPPEPMGAEDPIPARPRRKRAASWWR